MTNKKNGTLYIGVTDDLVRRVAEHKDNANPGFTSKYGLHTLVYYEKSGNITDTIQREKQLKNWHRKRKINLIETVNKEWEDLSDNI